MDKYYEAFKNIKGNRDIVFKTVLNYFDNRSINIIEIGCARDLNIKSRQSDGWSTCFWVDYIIKNGNKVEIYDVNETSIKNCGEIIKYWTKKPSSKIRILNKLYEGDYKGFDLAFLDGSDNPEETFSQYEKCKQAKIEIILIDDFQSKGRLIKDTPDIVWKWRNGHKVAVYGIKMGEIEVEGEF